MIEEKKYQEIIKEMPIPTVDVIIFDETTKEVLLQKRNNNPAKGILYSIGGRITKGEELKEGAIRKMKEELGITKTKEELQEAGVISEYWENSYFSEETTTHCIDIYFTTTINKKEKITLDQQHSTTEWRNTENIRDLHPYLQEKIKKAKNKIITWKKKQKYS